MPRQEIPDQYDLIVIGSGMSGLAAASTAAQLKNWRVLVLERHFTIGGYIHSFKRHGYEWDPGFHYVGVMDQGSPTRDYMDFVTGGQVDWNQMDESFETLIFPDKTYEIPSSASEHKALLLEEFPHEAEGIEKYFVDIFKVQKWTQMWFFNKTFPNWLAKLLNMGKTREMAEMLTQDYMDQNFTDPQLKAILTCQWGDYGTPPGRSAFGVHATVTADYMDGGYYAVGGAQAIADAAVRMVERFGGHAVTRAKVDEILIENGRAVGVRAETKRGMKEFYAPRVMSAAGVETTFNKLVPEAYGKPERARLETHDRGISATILFMGIKEDPRKHGFKDTNYWMYDKLDHQYEPDVGFPPLIGNTTLSFASLRNPALKQHVAQLVTFSAYHDWAEHKGTEWRRRGDDYAAKKEQYIDVLLDWVEERVPNLRDLIEFRELATPLTFESFTGHIDGQVYGRECTPDRIKTNWSMMTSVKGLYLTGTDICIPGVNSALMMGVIAGSSFYYGPVGMLTVASRAKKLYGGRDTSSGGGGFEAAAPVPAK